MIADIHLSTHGGNTMKKFAAAVAMGIGALVLAPVQPADAATNCVSKAEFRKVTHGMTKTRVHRIFDTAGKQSFVMGGYESREYKTCTSRYGFVYVDYDHKKVDSKSAFWG